MVTLWDVGQEYGPLLCYSIKTWYREIGMNSLSSVCLSLSFLTIPIVLFRAHSVLQLLVVLICSALAVLCLGVVVRFFAQMLRWK